ncbi:Ego4p NDAI_0K02270 [Naumovozyma dairenensis CBS 421]|uniref:Uncharacterized protein n=1 Tax=Naumovozyma dairenensis (strain ATCC 10597 / BCRC 20456 / CBS 421 / NBRC 0211 / NRRL Y-12639) TaxID=1071378 RepID=G0WI07_NAUDC|nr:hypothetical protein NDAI_0K02270 [Naumovozyma dairenensis CBS 421]CCD27418.1 hypothetical protein NDAI_0K02270 [Naumovozyma dairenensis CBS 421]
MTKNDLKEFKTYEQLLPRALGTLTFDEKKNLVDTSGFGKELSKTTHIPEILRKCDKELGRIGYTVFDDSRHVGRAFQKGGKTVVLFTEKSGEDSWHTNDKDNHGVMLPTN